ncbi:Wadjet anti-phage system protein JetD domain-containing protein [Solilutibacter tolerans]|uniref:Wadjet anti-phage system protein JetD domain-containing protein n=1 Tax=Solilutibacter tolerans TaxID=1604334 RepID=UPI00101AE25A|nr:Wadjet anti-phage system protein JetD domain-containing protein [Lysobacter tolerans]
MDAVLREQLGRGERKSVSGSSSVPQKSNLKPTNSIYWQQNFEERMRGHGQIRDAVKYGAVTAGWGDQGGDDRPLEWVRVDDVELLASLLGIATNATQLQVAQKNLEAWTDAYPRLIEVLKAWERLRRVRGLAPDSWRSWRDALRVLDAVVAMPGEDQVIRVLSGRLFSDTKRIEKLLPQLDVLSGEGLSSRPRGKWEVLRTLGLVKQPMPLLIAGTGKILMHEGPDCTIVHPYVGVAPRSVRGLEATPSWVLSIENLTTFHLAAEALKCREDGLVVFTGGMPSPAWVTGFRSLTGSLPTTAVFYHWGDIDVGGFRIAARLQEVALPEGVSLQPWLMDVTKCGRGNAVSESIGDAMRAAAVRVGWSELGELPSLALEQEQIELKLPESQ